MQTSRRFEAVIFDFGGVITASPFEAFNRLEAERGLPRDFVRRVNATNPDANAWALFERAEIDAARFDALFAQEAAAWVRHQNDGKEKKPTIDIGGIILTEPSESDLDIALKENQLL